MRQLEQNRATRRRGMSTTIGTGCYDAVNSSEMSVIIRLRRDQADKMQTYAPAGIRRRSNEDV